MRFNNCECGAIKPKYTPTCGDCASLEKKKSNSKRIEITSYAQDIKTGQQVQGKHIEHMGTHYIYDGAMHPINIVKMGNNISIGGKLL